jgi:hypothetical protein
MMSRRTRGIAIVAFLLIGAFGALNWVGRRRVYRTVESSEAVLDAAGVVPGISPSRLLAILDSLGFEHSALSADGKVGARLGRSFEEFMIQGDLLAQFSFDSTGRLSTRHVREVLTGP